MEYSRVNDRHIASIASELSIPGERVRAAATLFAEGATVPFIARYRKEATGSLDEVQLTEIRDGMAKLADLDKRRTAILESLTERELLTPELGSAIAAATTLTDLEDIYLPFRPKRRTRATQARERGLEPLADQLFAQSQNLDPQKAAAAFVDPEKDVPTIEEALQGARDIIAERISEDANAREGMRDLFRRTGEVRSKVIRGRQEEAAKFQDYFDWAEPLGRAASHRILAMRRGEREKLLRFSIVPPEEEALRLLEWGFAKNNSAAADEVRLAIADSNARLLGPAIETEIRREQFAKAEAEAIKVFASNLRELLLASPLGAKRVLALDPGFRTGCKLVCLGVGGELLANDTIYPHSGKGRAAEAEVIVLRHLKKHNCDLVAIGNGTAGRETEAWLGTFKLPGDPPVVMVNESGASIYSASEVARREFPDEDLTVRGTVSIGRRLQDPLAELVKLDPKSIGVGQYQHDVDQGDLKRSLDDVVVSCVNAVGVDVNTASEELLGYVSGLGPSLAASIVGKRSTAGAFGSRRELLKVPRLGPKAFEQAAGFLRIRDAASPLDGSAVHPERYPLVKQMAKDVGCSVADLLADAALREKIDPKQYVSDSVGLPTLKDILAELAKPGRDPRSAFEPFKFSQDVNKIEDLEEGMRLPGIVTNVTDFGAFIDIGVHQDGLAHISQIADRYVKHPSDVLKVQQKVSATVIGIDLPRKRISLSLKKGG